MNRARGPSMAPRAYADAGQAEVAHDPRRPASGRPTTVCAVPRPCVDWHPTMNACTKPLDLHLPEAAAGYVGSLLAVRPIAVRVSRPRRLSETQRSACGECCRVHNGGVFDARFVMRFVATVPRAHAHPDPARGG